MHQYASTLNLRNTVFTTQKQMPSTAAHQFLK